MRGKVGRREAPTLFPVSSPAFSSAFCEKVRILRPVLPTLSSTFDPTNFTWTIDKSNREKYLIPYFLCYVNWEEISSDQLQLKTEKRQGLEHFGF